MRLTFLIMALLLVGYAGNTSAQISNIEDAQLTWSWINPHGQSMDGYATKQEAVAAMQASCTVCSELVLEGKKTVSEDQTRYEYTSKKIPPVPSDEWVYPAIKLLLVFSRGVPEFSTLFTTGEEQNAHTQAVQLDPADSVCGDNYIAPDGGWLPALPPSQGGNLVTFEPEYYQQYLSVPANSVFADVEWNEQWKVGSWNWEEEVAGQNYCFGPGSFSQDYAHLRLRALVCEEPYIEPLERMCILPEKAYIISLRNSECDETESNPCNPATGAKLAKAIDITTGDLQFVRHYNSRGYSDAGFGENWTHNYYKRLTGGTSTGDDVSLVTGSGQQMNFPYSQAQTDLAGQGVPVYTSVDSRNISIAVVPSTYGIQSYFLRQPNGVVERYDEYGRLTQMDDRGVVTDITYNREGLMTKISTDVGHSLNFTYNPDDTISQITTGSGEVYNYAYQQNTLASVTYPSENGAGVTRQYHYENANFKYHLTGITDENQQRFGTYGYDTAGRTILSEHAQTTNGQPQHQFTFSYEGIGQTLVTDPDGTQQRWTFSRNKGFNNAVQKQNLTDNKSRLQSFDSNNNLLERIDPEGRIIQFSYNAQDQMVSKTIAAGTAQQRQINYEYALPASNVVTRISEPSVRAGESKVTDITYDSNLKINGITVNGFTSQGSAVSRSIALAYNDRGRLTQIDGPRTDVSDISSLSYYDCTTGAECGQLQQVTNALGYSVSFDSYDADARLTQMTDANGVVTQLSYYPRGWIKQMTRSAAGQASKVTNYQYDAMGQVTQISLPDSVVLNYSYDAAHELRSVSDNLGNRIEYTYDTRGNRIEHKVIDPDNSLVNQINLHYDQRNYVSQISSAGSIGQIVNDASGNPIGFTDPLENPDSGYQHDALNRLQQTVDALGNTTGYDYNVADQVIEVQAPNGATTQYNYDDLGNLLKEISPDRGTTTYTYDAAGNVISMTDARGITVNYQYDALNRLTQVSYPDTQENISYVYEDAAACPNNGVGRLCRVSNSAGSTTYQYDPWGNTVQVDTVQKKTNGDVIGSYTTHYVYDVGNRLIEQHNPSGLVLTYQRDAIGRVTQANSTWQGNTKTLISNRSYRADGQSKGHTLGNGIAETRTYDSQGRLIQQSLSGITDFNYTYDANGNVLSKQVTATATTATFSYDPLNRLSAETGSVGQQQLTYDANGNRLNLNVNGDNYAHSYDVNSNRLNQLGPWNNTLDVVGNTLTDLGGGRLYSYNQRNQLSEFRNADDSLIVAYDYDYRNLRTHKEAQIGGASGSNLLINYQYDLNGQVLERYFEGSVLQQSYVWLDGAPIAKIEITATGQQNILYLVTDHLNTPRYGLNQAGAVTWLWDSDGFGRLPAVADPDGDGVNEEMHLRFPGQYYDIESGLHYNWHRYYDPKVGRYVTSDPIGLLGGGNTYGYVAGNPLKWTDPFGLAPGTWSDGNYWDNDGQENPGWRNQINNAYSQVGYGIANGWMYHPVVGELFGAPLSIAGQAIGKGLGYLRHIRSASGAGSVTQAGEQCTNQTIALGKSIGLDDFASSQSARTLMNDPNFLGTIFTELRAGTKFSVDLSGVGGSINGSLTRAATGRGSPFDLELLEIRTFLKEGGDAKQFDFFLYGERVPNPF
ncbi:MAG: RHS repeat domain-containing protein [Arenicella sp.]